MKEDISIQDVIHNKPALISYLDSEQYMKFFFNENYFPIIQILKNGPKTVKDIYDSYPSTKDNQNTDKKNVDSSVSRRTKKKSENTIYNYIRDLIDGGVVIESGRRVQSNQVSAKILYSLSSQLMLIDYKAIEIWSTGQGVLMAKTLGSFLRRHFDNKLPSIDRFLALISKYIQGTSKLREELLRKLLTERNSQTLVDINSTLESINALNPPDYFIFTHFLGRVLWLLTIDDLDSINNDLSSIFTEKTDDFPLQSKKEESWEQRNKFQDIITFKPDVIKILSMQEFRHYFGNERYKAITDILRAGPCTIKELTSQHYSVLLQNIKPKKSYTLQSSENMITPPKEPYKENTIYSFVKKLIEGGLVVKAGRRVIPEQTSTQVLYARTAKVFYTLDCIPIPSELAIQAIGNTLKYHFNKQILDFEKFKFILFKLESTIRKKLVENLKQTVDDLNVTPVITFSEREQWTFLEVLGIFLWFVTTRKETKEGIKKQIIDCFS
ncbi:MAG: hypothetical protein ACFFBD_06340 [Candidatus Hodarchaeota archaeon]